MLCRFSFFTYFLDLCLTWRASLAIIIIPNNLLIYFVSLLVESTPLHGSWLIKDATAIKDSPLTRNQTSVKADTESTAADKMVATDKEQTTYKEGKENIARLN